MMNRLDIVRAWKDEEYRNSLSKAELAALPENPAGLTELEAGDLGGAAGGNGRIRNTSPLVCHTIPLTLRALCAPRTLPSECPPVTLPPRCPLHTLAVSCPRRTVACPF
jgi:mersacidin/lichenicidin family type 2 lantibiotic